MGFINKQRTKARTAPTAHPTTLSTEWPTDGMPAMAAVVRAVACSVGAQANLRSSSFRGRDMLGIGSALLGGQSTIWVEQPRYSVWTVGLGADTVGGPAYDWQLVLTASRQGDEMVVTISTPAVLTSDGAQVHKDEYLDLRELTVAGLASMHPPDLAPELAAGRQGLSFFTAPFTAEPLTPYDGEFAIETAMDAGKLRELLPYLPFPQAEGSVERWFLGVQAAKEQSWVDLVVAESGNGRVLNFRVHLAHSESAATNAITTRRAGRFAAFVHSLVRRHDASAAISGGAGLVDGVA